MFKKETCLTCSIKTSAFFQKFLPSKKPGYQIHQFINNVISVNIFTCDTPVWDGLPAGPSSGLRSRVGPRDRLGTQNQVTATLADLTDISIKLLTGIYLQHSYPIALGASEGFVRPNFQFFYILIIHNRD